MDKLSDIEYAKLLSESFDSMRGEEILFKVAKTIEWGNSMWSTTPRPSSIFYPVLCRYDYEPYNTWEYFSSLFSVNVGRPNKYGWHAFWVISEMQPQWIETQLPSNSFGDLIADLSNMWIFQDEGNTFYKISYDNLNLPALGILSSVNWKIYCQVNSLYGSDAFFAYFAKHHFQGLSKQSIMQCLSLVRNRYIYRGEFDGSYKPITTAEKGSSSESLKKNDWNSHTSMVMEKFDKEFVSIEERKVLKIIKEFCGGELGVASLNLKLDGYSVDKLFDILIGMHFISQSSNRKAFQYYMTGRGDKPVEKIVWSGSAESFYAFFDLVTDKAGSRRMWGVAEQVFVTDFIISNTGYQSLLRSEPIYKTREELSKSWGSSNR